MGEMATFIGFCIVRVQQTDDCSGLTRLKKYWVRESHSMGLVAVTARPVSGDCTTRTLWAIQGLAEAV